MRAYIERRIAYLRDLRESVLLKGDLDARIDELRRLVSAQASGSDAGLSWPPSLPASSSSSSSLSVRGSQTKGDE